MPELGGRRSAGRGRGAGWRRWGWGARARRLLRGQAVADGLHCGRVGDGGEPVVQRGELDAGPARLTLGPLVAVDAQLGGEREVRAELDEQRAEVVVEAVEVEVVDQQAVAHQPRVG